MKSLIILGLGIWVGMHLVGAAGGSVLSVPLDGHVWQDFGSQLGSALSGGIAVLVLAGASVIVLGIMSIVLIGTLAISFPVVLLTLLVGVLVLPALLPFLLMLLILGLMLKMFTAMVCW